MTTDKEFLKAVMRFMRAANNLVDAANDRAKYEGGSRGRAKADERFERCDAAYRETYDALDVLVEERQ